MTICSASSMSPEMPAWLFFKLVIILLSVISAAVVVVDAHHEEEGQGTAEFISIDCGYSGSNYTDAQTTIPYTSDEQYIVTGETHNISAANSLPKRLQTLRSFPSATSPLRNCYTLGSVEKNKPYLLRATFLHGDYDGGSPSNGAAVNFDLHIDVNLCKTVNITDPSTPYVVEVIALTLAETISVCLIDTQSGTPFISALELRPVADTVLYDYLNKTQSVVLFLRLDLGTTTNEVIRYPDDSFDRLWDPWSAWSDKLSFQPSSVRSISTNETLEDTDEEFETPKLVMQTAAAPAKSNVLEFSWDFAGSGAPANAFFANLHFAELEKSTSSRVFNIYLNGAVLYPNVTPKYLTPDTQSKKPPVPLPQSPRYQWALNSTGLAQLPPILNALEVYTRMQLTNSLTDSEDVSAITLIKNEYTLTRNWMGDPCTPMQYAWEGLNCSYGSDSDSDSTRIEVINLSSSALIGTISSSFASLQEIKSLDLSDNNLTGSIPDELGNLPSLGYLNLTGNNLTGHIPASLLQKREQGKLTFGYEGNPYLCTGVTPCEEDRKSKKLATPVIAVLCSISVLLLLVVAFMVWKLRKSQVNFSKLLKGRRDNPLQLESRQFTYNELETITDNFKNGIGKGGFGVVYRGRLEDGSQVAVKLRSQLSSQGTKEFLAEAQNLTRIHHKNLVSLVGYCMDGDHLALVYEFMPMGTLHDHLRDKTPSGSALSWGQRLQIALDAAQGLEYLHKGCKPPLVHRDVKTSNILLSENLEAKIADFGLSKAFPNDGDSHVSTSVVGTPGYLDPEYYFNYQLSEKSDIYSFGVVLLELITGQPPVLKVPRNNSLIQWVHQSLAEGNIEDVVDANLQGQYDVNSIWKAADVAFRCTSRVSHQRPTMTDVVVELKESLALETMRERLESPHASNKNIDSQTSVHEVDYFSGIAPAAR